MTEEEEPKNPLPRATPHSDQEPLLIGGIDKELLGEVGRASAVQTLSTQVQQIGDIAAAVQKVTADALIDENRKVHKINRLLLIGIGLLLLLCSVLTFNSFSNRITLEKLDKNQEGIDELVAYLRTIPAQQAGTAKVVTDLETLICLSSNDLDLVAECNRLGLLNPPQG